MLGGRLVVYQRVPAEVGNANHWYAVSVAPRPVTVLSSIGWAPTAVAAVALVAIGYAAAALRRAQRALLAAANTDPLTGLRNRRRLVADLNRLVPRATPERPLLLMLSDLNMFKAYNDTFGHPEGDQLLVRLAASLSAALGRRGEVRGRHRVARRDHPGGRDPGPAGGDAPGGPADVRAEAQPAVDRPGRRGP
jgi:predicted signal transduction protein with EAL and GGDEF domain